MVIEKDALFFIIEYIIREWILSSDKGFVAGFPLPAGSILSVVLYESRKMLYLLIFHIYMMLGSKDA